MVGRDASHYGMYGGNVSHNAMSGGGWNNYKANYQKPQKTVSPNDIATARSGKLQFNKFGERIDKFHWHGEDLVPVTKEFNLSEHPNVKSRSEEEHDDIRLEYSISVKMSGSDKQIPKPIAAFEELSFPDWAINCLIEMNFEKPTAIQVQAWPAALWGNDIIGIAETGSGKTLAYIMPMLIHIKAQPELRPEEGPVGLILIHSRELCHQVEAEVNKFKDHTDMTCVALTGGEDERIQADQMLGKVDIVVATPGRLIHLLNVQKTNLRRATYVVIDEADCLFSGDFAKQIQVVLANVRPDRQVLLFSATWDNNVEKVAQEICVYEPITIHVGDIGLKACKDVAQYVTLVSDKRVGPECLWDKSKSDIAALSIQKAGDAKVLVFVNWTKSIDQVVAELRERGVACEGFARNLGKGTQTVLTRFLDPDGDVKVIVSTSLLARGHDFQDLKYVVNYDMPEDMVDYVHRIGRTGRAGKKGQALTLMEEGDLWIARQLAQCLRRTEQDVPGWLEEAGRRSRKKKKKATVAHAEEQPQQVAWQGRGIGQREEVLRRLCGLGVARGRMGMVPEYS